MGIPLCLSGNPKWGFPDRLLQSAARTSCAPMAHKTHTCGLRSIFCQVHAPAENDLTLFADYRRQTLRGFFDRPRGIPVGIPLAVSFRFP